MYDFNPLPKELSADKQSFILGGQANLWTEYVGSFEHVQYMVYPRALAMSQVLWSVNKPPFADFTNTFIQYQQNILNKLGVNYSKSIYRPQIDISSTENGIAYSIKSIDSTQQFEVRTIDSQTAQKYRHHFTTKDSLFFSRAGNGELKVVSLIASTDKVEGHQETELHLHDGIGYSVDLITKPHSKYTNKEGFTLVDGIVSGRPWKGDQWLGFDREDVSFIIDIEDKKKIEKVTISCLKSEGSWIYLPENVKVSISNHKWFWRNVTRKQIQQEKELISINKKGRFLKIELTGKDKIPEGRQGEGYQPFIFIDEVILKLGI